MRELTRSEYRRRGICVGVLLWVCTGCSLSATEQQYFQLPESARGKLETKESEKACATLLVHEMAGNSIFNSRRIVFSSDPIELGAYQFASWIEPPPARLSFLLRELLQESGGFRAVSPLSGSAVGELELDTELVDFSHDTSANPGEVRVRIRSTLVNLKSRSVLAEKIFSSKEKVEEFTSKGAVQAFTKATEQILPIITAWTVEHACALRVDAGTGS